MRKFLIPPDQEGYSVKDGNEVISVVLDGGASRSRSDIRNSASRVTCTWKTNGFGYEYIRTFFKVGASSAALPFLIDLYGEFETLTEHTAKFVPGTMTLSSQRGNSFIVNAELEVLPNAEDFAYQEDMMILYDNLDLELAWFFAALEKAANVDFPEWWGPLPEANVIQLTTDLVAGGTGSFGPKTLTSNDGIYSAKSGNTLIHANSVCVYFNVTSSKIDYSDIGENDGFELAFIKAVGFSTKTRLLVETPDGGSSFDLMLINFTPSSSDFVNISAPLDSAEWCLRVSKTEKQLYINNVKVLEISETEDAETVYFAATAFNFNAVDGITISFLETPLYPKLGLNLFEPA